MQSSLLGTGVSKTGCEEPKLFQSAGVCLRKVLYISIRAGIRYFFGTGGIGIRYLETGNSVSAFRYLPKIGHSLSVFRYFRKENLNM